VKLSDYSPYKTQSCVEDYYQQSENSAPALGSYDNPMLIIAGNSLAVPPKSRYLINIGENVVSLRKLLRRTCYHSSVSYKDTGDNSGKLNILDIRHNRIPELLGYDTNAGLGSSKGIITPATTFNCNIIRNSPFTWLYPCFAASRGAINWHHHWNSVFLTNTTIPPPAQPVAITIGAVRDSVKVLTAGSFGLGNNALTTGNSFGNAAFYECQYGAETISSAGMSLQNPSINKIVSFVAPNYNQYKFNFNTLGNSTGTAWNVTDSLDTGTRFDTYGSTCRFIGSTTTFNTYTTCDKYFSIGADFTFLYFLCVPAMYSTPVGSMNPQ